MATYPGGSFGTGPAYAQRVVTRAMPGDRTNISTGSTTLLNMGTRHSALDRVGAAADINAPVGQPSTVPSNPTPSGRRVLFTQPIGMGSRRFNTVDVNGASRKRKAPFGGNTQQELNEMGRWAPTSAKLPRLGGLPAPDMSRELRGELGYPMYADFAAKPDAFPDGPLPNTRTAGTGGIAWGNFGSKLTVLNTHQPGPSPGAWPGTAAQSRFITPGEQITGSFSTRSVFLSYPWSNAEAQIIQDGDIEPRTNATVPYHYILATKYKEFCEADQEGQIILSQRRHFPVSDPHDYNMPREQSPFITSNLLNLPTFNFMQACNEKLPQIMGRSLMAAEVLKQWNIAGFCRNDPSAKIAAGAPSRAYPNQYGQWQRIINTVVAGPTFVFNYWGNGVVVGQKLYVILKKVDLQNVRADSKSEAGSYDISMRSSSSSRSANLEDRSPRPFQLLPWIPAANTRNPPTMRDKQYHDEFGQVNYGIAFCLGTVDQIDDFSTPDHILQHAPFSVKATVSLPKIKVIVSLQMV